MVNDVPSSGGNDQSGAGVLVVIIVLFLYFIPSIVAFVRGHRRAQVLVLNLFLGWTLIGWTVALVMALGSKTVTVVHRMAPPASGPVVSPDGQYWWDGTVWRPVRPPGDPSGSGAMQTEPVSREDSATNSPKT